VQLADRSSQQQAFTLLPKLWSEIYIAYQQLTSSVFWAVCILKEIEYVKVVGKLTTSDAAQARKPTAAGCTVDFA